MILSQTSAGLDDPVAGNQKTDGVAAHRSTHRPHGSGAADTPGNVAVGRDRARRYTKQRFPDFQLEVGALCQHGQALQVVFYWRKNLLDHGLRRVRCVPEFGEMPAAAEFLEFRSLSLLVHKTQSANTPVRQCHETHAEGRVMVAVANAEAGATFAPGAGCDALDIDKQIIDPRLRGKPRFFGCRLQVG